MGITQLTPIKMMQVGVQPGSFKMVTTDNLSTVTTAGYLKQGVGGNTFVNNDLIETIYNSATISPVNIVLAVSVSLLTGIITLSPEASAGGGTASGKNATDNSQPNVSSTVGAFVVNDLIAAADTLGSIKDSGVSPSDATKPKVSSVNGATVVGDIAIFSDVLGTIRDLGVSPSDATKAKVASVNGAVVVGHIATYSDVLGTITDGGPVPSAGSVPAPEMRSDATALTAADITANEALGQYRYVLSSATGVPITLPPATGSGVVLTFFCGLMPTSNGYVFNCDSTGTLDRFDSDLTRYAGSDAAVLNQNGTAAGNHNRMTLLNGIAGTGGAQGDVIRLTDYIADHWLVEGTITAGAGALAVFSSF